MPPAWTARRSSEVVDVERQGLRAALASYAHALVPRSLAEAAPGLAMLLRYPRSYLRSDLVAGVTVGAVAVPSSLAMAELAGMPVVFGLYGTFLPLAVYALIGTSRQHVVGPDSTLAALTAVTLAPLAMVGGEVDPARYVALAAALALAMGAMLLLAGVFRLGFFADFFGKPVLLGYINGVALIVIASQLGKLLGISVGASDFFPVVWEAVSKVSDANGPTVLLSAGLLAAALAVRRFLPAVPPSLVVLTLALVISALVDLEGHGIAVVGEVEGGLPSFGLPRVGAHDFLDLVLPAAAFSLVAFADLIATVRTFAQRHGYEIDANRELTAIGGANLIGGLTGAFPVSSSNSRSAVNDSAGARSQAAVLVAAVVVGLFLLFAMPLIEPLPTAALGVIIVVAAAGLINVHSIWRLRRVRSAEAALALVAFGGVLTFGVVGGVVVAIALSIGVFLYRAARPHDAVLGRVDDVDGYHDVGRWEGAETVPGLLVYRFDAPPFFVNAEYLRQRVLALADASEDVRWLVLNAEAWTFLDSTAIDVLSRLQGELEQRGVALCFARLKGRQREIFEDTGLTARIGPDRFFPTVRAAVAAFESVHAGETG
jgi:SulP family sulfate permease